MTTTKQLDLTGDLAIEQGATFDWLLLVIEGDWTNWVARGKIRKDFADNTGDTVVDFSFAPIVLGGVVVNGVTKSGSLIAPTLSAAQTEALRLGNLRPRRSPQERLEPGVNCWRYDIEIWQGAVVRRILEGNVELSQEVTR